MENQLVWEDRFNIGVDVIDKEHQKLFRIINKLFKFGEDEEKSKWVCQEGIKYFKDHAIKHFADEESYMESINYGGLERHKRIHTDFREKILPALEKELERTAYADDSVEHFLGVCTGWLIGHTLTEDHAITGTAVSKWENLLPEEELDAMKEVVLQQVYDMFQLESHVISESYGGEKFGKGIYYRLLYVNDEKKKWETFLVFEEKLLFNTVGKMIGIKTKKMSPMLLNTVRYTARRFVESILKNFATGDTYSIKAENLLSYEQFKKVFEREKLQTSLLIDTGMGYFAYCVSAQHLSENKVGASIIEADNAMEEVEKYIENNETTQEQIKNKKKILVVDDSAVILKAMEDLLGKDYEVACVKSGVSAISSLALNRPDLILLDYEMPVCDGKQVLEMIRSEQDFADISVIFLTGRVDRESVKKVLELKPAGYLVKSVPPAEIKKHIDSFFQKQK